MIVPGGALVPALTWPFMSSGVGWAPGASCDAGLCHGPVGSAAGI